MGVQGDSKVNKRAETRAKQQEDKKADGWIGFVNCELTEEQKADCKRHIGAFDQAWKDLHDLIAVGYKMTVSYDEIHTTWNVSLTGRKDTGKNQGLTLTGRGGSEAAAYVSLWYKHEIVLKRDWSSQAQPDRFRLRPDDIA